MIKFTKGIFISAVLFMSSLGFICGQSGNKSENVTTGNTEKKETQNKDIGNQTQGVYKIIHKEIIDTNTQENYNISITYPQIDGLNNASQDKFNSYAASMMKVRADTFRINMKSWTNKSEIGSEFDITDTVVYMTGSVISVLFDGYSSFAGTAHPSHFSLSINYDLKNNKPLKLSDIFTGNYLEIISQASIAQIIKQKKENTPGENVDAGIVKEGAGPKENNFSVFNITSDTLFISFPEYQVASYVEGDFVTAIPYSSLKSVIKPSGVLSEKVK